MEEEKSDIHEEKKSEEPVEKKEKICNKENLTDKMRENPWIASTLVLGILGLILLMGNFSGGVSGNVISEEEAGEAILNLAKLQIEDAELIEINSKNGLYEIILSMEDREIPVYLTMDGENLVQGVMPLAVLMEQQPSTFSEEDNIKIQEFSSCLVEKDFKIYGAAWCGHCQTVVKTFGGMQNMEGVFIECSDANRQPTEYAQLCSDQQITGFPTMKLGDETLQIARTFEAIAEATGCSVPDVSIQQNSDTQEASCS